MLRAKLKLSLAEKEVKKEWGGEGKQAGIVLCTKI